MKITITLSDEELHGVLETAGMYGCGYWARSNVPFTSAATRAIGIRDRDNPEVLLGTLSPKKLRTLTIEGGTGGAVAIATAAAKGCFDANAADVWVQLALFGEVRYG